MLSAAATAVAFVFMAAALIGAVYALAAAVAVLRFFRRPHPQTWDFPALTVLKPLYRAEPGLRENLQSFFTQDYPASVQIVFGVTAPDDSAIPIVNDLIAHFPKADATLAVGARYESGNPKITNLIGMMPHAKHGVLVLSDSDIGVPQDYLRRVAGALAEPGTGAVTCCYIGRPLNNPWSKLAAQGIDYHFLPSVIAGMALGLAKPCFGSTIALKRVVLDAIGGFEAFRDRLADDYEIGHAVRAHGLNVAVPPFAVSHSCAETSLRALLAHELRWARTIRLVDPLGFAGSAITHALLLSLIGAALAGFSSASLAVIAVAIGARFVLKFSVDWALSRPGTGYELFPLRDMLSFAVFVASFFAGRVDWRGARFRVHADGDLARE